MASFPDVPMTKVVLPNQSTCTFPSSKPAVAMNLIVPDSLTWIGPFQKPAVFVRTPEPFCTPDESNTTFIETKVASLPKSSGTLASSPPSSTTSTVPPSCAGAARLQALIVAIARTAGASNAGSKGWQIQLRDRYAAFHWTAQDHDTPLAIPCRVSRVRPTISLPRTNSKPLGFLYCGFQIHSTHHPPFSCASYSRLPRIVTLTTESAAHVHDTLPARLPHDLGGWPCHRPGQRHSPAFQEDDTALSLCFPGLFSRSHDLCVLRRTLCRCSGPTCPCLGRAPWVSGQHSAGSSAVWPSSR